MDYKYKWFNNSLLATKCVGVVHTLKDVIGADPFGHDLENPQIDVQLAIRAFLGDAGVKKIATMDDGLNGKPRIRSKQFPIEYMAKDKEDTVKSINGEFSINTLIGFRPRIATRVVQQHHVHVLQDLLIMYHRGDCGCPRGKWDWVAKEEPEPVEKRRRHRRSGTVVGQGWQKKAPILPGCLHELKSKVKEGTIQPGESYTDPLTMDLMFDAYRCSVCKQVWNVERLQNKLPLLTYKALEAVRHLTKAPTEVEDIVFSRQTPSDTNIQRYVEWKRKNSKHASRRVMRRTKRQLGAAIEFYDSEYK